MMTSPPEVAASTTLSDPDFGATTVISGDVAAELSKLNQPGKDIAVGPAAPW